MEESLIPSKRGTHPPSGRAASPQVFYPLWPHEQHRWALDPEGNADGRCLLMIGNDWNLPRVFDWPAHSAIILHQDNIRLSYKQNYLLHCHGCKLFFDHPECIAARGPAARTWAATSCTKMARMMMGSWSIRDHMWESAFVTANVLVNRDNKRQRLLTRSYTCRRGRTDKEVYGQRKIRAVRFPDVHDPHFRDTLDPARTHQLMVAIVATLDHH